MIVNWIVKQLFGAPNGNATISRAANEYVRYRKTPHQVHGFNLSMEVLTPDLISRICNLYAMDVHMIETTNVTQTICGARNVKF